MGTDDVERLQRGAGARRVVSEVCVFFFFKQKTAYEL